jgi:predicted RNase H-like HicB family nuclease
MATMFFPAIVESGTTSGYGVFFPDLPGCTSAGDTIEQAARNAEDALRGHIGLMVRDGDVVPAQRPMDQIERDPDVIEVSRILVPLDMAKMRPEERARLEDIQDIWAAQKASTGETLPREFAMRVIVDGEDLETVLQEYRQHGNR